MPICHSIGETITSEKEKEFIVHLKKEIQRLKRVGKSASNVKANCVNMDCKSSNNLNTNNVDSYGVCGNCGKF